MALLKFSPYAPDITDLDTDVSDKVQNVFPRADGYGPAQDLLAYTATLPGICRGYIYARNSDGSISVFAATSTNIYLLNNTTLAWSNVSLGGGPYSTLNSTDNWQFIQFGADVLAVQVGVAPQRFTIGSSSAFANLAGSPPQAKYIAVINQFVVLSGISGAPYRVQWSGLNAITTWDNVTLQSNFQDFADGGLALTVAGGENYGIVFQNAAIRQMTFAPGSPYTFFIQRIAQDDGLYAAYSVVRAGDEIYFISPQGFKKIPSGGGYPVFVGKERIDRTFFADVDAGNLQLVLGGNDPTSTRVFFAYKSQAGQANLFDKMLVYDRILDAWSVLVISGEYISSVCKPGITLEGLDAIAPSGALTITGATNNGSGLVRLTITGNATTVSWTYTLGDTALGIGPGQPGSNALVNFNTIEVWGVNGTTEANGNWHFTLVGATATSSNIDLIGSTFTNAYTSGGAIGGAMDSLSFSLDAFTSAAQAQFSAFSTSHALGFFSGQNLQATIETTQTDLGGRRLFIGGGFRVLSDAPSIFGSLGTRDSPQAASVQTNETAINATGVCPQRVETRYARARVRIPYGTAWTYAEGVEPHDMQPAGTR